MRAIWTPVQSVKFQDPLQAGYAPRRDELENRVVMSQLQFPFSPPILRVRPLALQHAVCVAHAASRFFVLPALRFIPLHPAGLLAACVPRPGAKSAPAGPPTPPTSARHVTFAVESGYAPFNFIRTDTRAAEGWDYAVAVELGRRLGFTPVFRWSW